MKIVDRGSGPPLVLIPGLQGRWEYQHATVDALAASFRVITFSVDGSDFDGYVRQVIDAMAQAAVDRAILCGVSFGGLIALRCASRYPSRCERLVLGSTPPPSLQLRWQHRLYLIAPRILGSLFILETPWRVRRELAAALPDPRARRRFSLDALRTFITAPVSLGKMAARGRIAATDAVAIDCATISAPTLIITGEPHLDFVVPHDGSAVYERLIPHARRVVLARTGHLGSMTRPDEFAALIRSFASDAGEEPGVRPRPTHRSAAPGQVA